VVLKRRPCYSALSRWSGAKKETGVRLAICDSLTLATVVLLNDFGASGLESQDRKPDPGLGYVAVKSFALRIRSNFVLSKRHRGLRIAESKA
jgi:hypothetical protein